MLAGLQGWHLIILLVLILGVALPIILVRRESQRRDEAVAAGAAPRVETNNVLAIISFVLAFFVSVAGVVCGHIALAQIHRTGERGWGLAVAGLWIGYAGILAGVAASIYLLIALSSIR